MPASIATKISEKNPMNGLLIAQFFGAFNDNAWKLIVFTLATRYLVADTVNFETSSQYQATLGFLLFLFPMMLFSLPGGILADKISKRTVIIRMKLFEVVLMGSAVISLFIFPKQVLLPYAVLALMGMQSALFGPAKYGILPELLPIEKLTRGNGLLEMWTMIAIIGGTGLGPIFLAFDLEGVLPAKTFLAPLGLFLLSTVGFYASGFLPKVNPAQEKNDVTIFESYKKTIKAIHGDKVLTLAIVGQAFYWFIISLLGQNILVYAKTLVQNLQKGEILQGIPLASYGIGIAIGAILAGRLSKDRIEYGLIPLGSIGFAITSIILGVLQPQIVGTCLILILMGGFSGSVIVPLHTLVQWRAPKDKRGGVIAIGNIFDITGMIAGSLFSAVMAFIGFKLGQMLLVSSFLVVLATIWSVKLLPEALLRLVAILLTLTFYRIRLNGKENIPIKGPALIACNHLSIIDALFIITMVRRPVHFIMKKKHYNKFWIKPIAKLMGAIPISEKIKNDAIKQANNFLEKGDLVCIFPEGQISLNGLMLPFGKDVELMMKERRCPIIPVHLDLVWGSIFSFESGRFFTKIPHQIPYPLTITVGKPLPANTPAKVIRASILELGTIAWEVRKEREDLAHRMFIRQARWKGLKKACFDQTRGKISRLKLLRDAILVTSRTRNLINNEKNIGIILPLSVLGVIGNLSLSLAGKAAINLNPQNPAFAIKEAGIKTIITTKEHSYLDLDTEVKIVDIEKIINQSTIFQKAGAYFLSLFAPIKIIEKFCGFNKKTDIDDPMTVLFTHCSQGIVLSHYNIMSNIEALSQSLPKTVLSDKLLAAIPLSSPFGYMQMWLGLIHDFELIFQPLALDTSAIGKLIQKHKINMMFTTPGYLSEYLKKGDPEKFSYLNYILVADGLLREKTADDFESRFGLKPSLGYGLAECSFFITNQAPFVRKKGLYQAGSLRGSLGQPIPGVSIKIADPETFMETPNGKVGLLMVKGPSVMLRYLNKNDKAIIKEGYFITKKYGSIDNEGNLLVKN